MSCFHPRTRTGATAPTLATHCRSVGFQPTHPHGVTSAETAVIPSASNVSTHPHPHRVRPVPATKEGTSSYAFSTPRTRTGCDLDDLFQRIVDGSVSTHAPAQGVRLFHALIINTANGVSTPHPARGATVDGPITSSTRRDCFNSTHPHGGATE